MLASSIADQRGVPETPAAIAASTNIPLDLAFLISHITNFVRVTLDSNNFFVWMKQLKNVLTALSLFGYIDGSCPCPPACL